MPALSHTIRLEKRDENTGRNFSIIFAVIAFVIVVGCLFWGIFLPKYRKKHPPRPSPTRYNGLQPHQAFPSHPALLQGFRKHPSHCLRKYNPRTQTPFPNTLPPGGSVSLPSLTPCNRSMDDIGWPNYREDIFFPARDRLPFRRCLPTDATLQHKPSQASLYPDLPTDDYSLPVPEPTALCPRAAGRPPTLARQLKRFPIPQSSSAGADKLTHPRKLFEDLEQRHSETTTITSLETPCPLPLNPREQHEFARKHTDQDKPLSQLNQLRSFSNGCPDLQNQGTVDIKNGMMSSNNTESEKRGKRESIVRGGTPTRPKTPVVEIQEICDGKDIHTAAERESFTKAAVISSVNSSTGSTISSYLRSTTPPTSPIERSTTGEHGTVTANSCNGDEHGMIRPTPDRAYEGNTASSVTLPLNDRLTRMDTIHEGRKEELKVGRLSKPNGKFARLRPVRLNLTLNARSTALNRRAPRHSTSSLRGLLMPLGKSKRTSIQASSVYSRDTRGVSIVRTPTSPAFSEIQPAEIVGGAGVLARKALSLDVLRSKIDDWDLHTAYLDFSTSPSSTLKRVVSDLGPKSPTFPAPGTASAAHGNRNGTSHQSVEPTIPKICVGRRSDDIFGDPSPNVQTGRVLNRVIDTEVAASMASLTRSLSNGSAPGGVNWI